MPHTKQTLVMVGAYEGQDVTLTLGLTDYKFTDGRITLEGSDTEVNALTCFLGLNFQALPEGSAELAAKQEEVARARQVHEHGEVRDGEGDLQGGAGEGSEVTTDPGNGGADDAATTGEAGAGDATRDGSRAIVEALSKLDPADDNAWTADGKPKMAALEVLLGRTDITRAQVEAAAPGFSRPVK
jgi:hypothetical protein